MVMLWLLLALGPLSSNGLNEIDSSCVKWTTAFTEGIGDFGCHLGSTWKTANCRSFQVGCESPAWLGDIELQCHEYRITGQPSTSAKWSTWVEVSGLWGLPTSRLLLSAKRDDEEALYVEITVKAMNGTTLLQTEILPATNSRLCIGQPIVFYCTSIFTGLLIVITLSRCFHTPKALHSVWPPCMTPPKLGVPSSTHTTCLAAQETTVWGHLLRSHPILQVFMSTTAEPFTPRKRVVAFLATQAISFDVVWAGNPLPRISTMQEDFAIAAVLSLVATTMNVILLPALCVVQHVGWKGGWCHRIANVIGMGWLIMWVLTPLMVFALGRITISVLEAFTFTFTLTMVVTFPLVTTAMYLLKCQIFGIAPPPTWTWGSPFSPVPLDPLACIVATPTDPNLMA